ncbi:hypothetical protein, partial [Rothia nasimurium]
MSAFHKPSKKTLGATAALSLGMVALMGSPAFAADSSEWVDLPTVIDEGSAWVSPVTGDVDGSTWVDENLNPLVTDKGEGVTHELPEGHIGINGPGTTLDLPEGHIGI